MKNVKSLIKKLYVEVGNAGETSLKQMDWENNRRGSTMTLKMFAIEPYSLKGNIYLGLKIIPPSDQLRLHVFIFSRMYCSFS